MSLQQTPNANRLHIGLFGKRNSGKSSIINALTGQNVAIVSDVAGTTADPIYKPMELHGIGPVVFIDTAGFDDEGKLGELRVAKTKSAMDKTDIALMIFSAESEDYSEELAWMEDFRKMNTPVIPVINKSDIIKDIADTSDNNFDKNTVNALNRIPISEDELSAMPIPVSAKNGDGIEGIRDAIINNLPEDYESDSITGTLVNEGDRVLLVMPQDIQAPKGRLILPQVQTLRELLDKKCIVTSCTTDKLQSTLDSFKESPDLIITDSQVFKTVYELKPEGSKLTSFSVLFAAYKGDSEYFKGGAKHIENLSENSRILIAEACTHKPLNEDIGRVQLPKLLRKKLGDNLSIDIVSGSDFPSDLSRYDLVITCGACMFNRKHVLSRVEKAKNQNVPMSNYGIVIAYLNGILNKVSII